MSLNKSQNHVIRLIRKAVRNLQAGDTLFALDEIREKHQGSITLNDTFHLAHISQRDTPSDFMADRDDDQKSYLRQLDQLLDLAICLVSEDLFSKIYNSEQQDSVLRGASTEFQLFLDDFAQQSDWKSKIAA